jgi:hypothetical protein
MEYEEKHNSLNLSLNLRPIWLIGQIYKIGKDWYNEEWVMGKGGVSCNLGIWNSLLFWPGILVDTNTFMILNKVCL